MRLTIKKTNEVEEPDYILSSPLKRRERLSSGVSNL